MKTKFLTLLILIACLCLPIKSFGQILTDFYTYTLINNDTEYKAELNSTFKTNYLNITDPTSFRSGSYTWNTGDPLPNPAPDGIYNGKPVTDISSMFANCNNLTNINLSKFNTSNVTNMNYMFLNCSALTSLDLSTFDTSKVTDMSAMFTACVSIKNINTSKFNTSKVVNMSNMFAACVILENIDISNFDTSNVTNMNGMFSHCTKLTVIDLSKLRTSNVTDMSAMFYGSYSLTSLDLSTFDTSKVTCMSDMFSGCSALTNINLSKFDTSKVTEMIGMFSDCSSLTNLELLNFNTSQVVFMSSMFNGCTSLENIDLSSFDTANVTDMSYMFENCGMASDETPALGLAMDPTTATKFNDSNATGIDATMLVFVVRNLNDFYQYELSSTGDSYKVSLNDNFRTAIGSGIFTGANSTSWTTNDALPNPAPNGLYDGKPITDMSFMFANCTNMKKINLSKFNTSNVTNMSYMFLNCSALKDINLSNFKTSKVTDISSMFSWCKVLEGVDISMFNTSNVTTMNNLFYGCEALKRADLSNFNTTKATTMGNMFLGCKALTDVNLSNFNTSNMIDMSNIFTECRSLTSIDVSNFDISNAKYIFGMFSGCSALKSLDLSNFDLTKIQDISSMFENCGVVDGSGQAAIGVAKDWNTAYAFNTSVSTGINTANLKFGIPDSYQGLSYVLFQDSDKSNKSATIVASKTDPYSNSITIADNVEVATDIYPVVAIAPYTFKGCTSLSSVDISKNVTKVGDLAFIGASSVINLNMHIDTPPAVTDLAFDPGQFTSSVLTVHNNAKSAYGSHSVWGKFLSMPTGLDNTLQNANIKIARIHNGVVVSGIEAGETVKLYSGDGALIRSVKASESSVTIDGVQSGMYIVNVGAKAVKVVI